MADIDIVNYTTTRVHTFKHGRPTISFKSDQDCTLAFTPAGDNCFGKGHIKLRAKVEKTENVHQYDVETSFTISGDATAESPLIEVPEVEETYSIDFDAG